MSEARPPLWRLGELVEAAAGQLDDEPTSSVAITGISIDTRTIEPGDLFVALKDVRDGHDFVTQAFEKGAAAALVAKSYERKDADGLLVRVDDPLSALERLAKAARARLKETARVVAVTGSAGKTTTKEMLRACFAAIGRVHASEKSYNNHWGVPLTLARMPAYTEFAVIEIGMNHPGEIRPLAKLARPHVAVITTVEAVHLEHFGSVEAIADAKAEIFAGLEPGGVAILPGDNPHFARLKAAAEGAGAIVRSFCAERSDCDLWIAQYGKTIKGDWVDQQIDAETKEGEIYPFEMGFAGAHMRSNALAVVLALLALDVDAALALAGLDEAQPGPGRGERTLIHLQTGDLLIIDESYNANPASMRAAIETAQEFIEPDFPRLVLVLGDMLELGEVAPQMHRDLIGVIERSEASAVFACGAMMQHFFDQLPAQRRGGYAANAEALQPLVLAALQPGDVVMIKASNGSRLGPLVTAVKDALQAQAAG